MLVQEYGELRAPVTMGQVTDSFIERVLPANPVPYLFAGAVMIGIGSMDQFENTAARPFVQGIGGLFLGLGMAPMLVSLFKR